MIPFVLTVSARQILDMPNAAGYIGNMILVCYFELPLCTVRPEMSSLGSLSQKTRKRLIEIDGGRGLVKRWVGAIGTVDDVRRIGSAFRGTKDYPFLITSWSSEKFYDIEWGPEVGGRCEAVRLLTDKGSPPRPDGMVAILPELEFGHPMAQEDGGSEVLITLEKGVMAKPRELLEWTAWADWRCS